MMEFLRRVAPSSGGTSLIELDLRFFMCMWAGSCTAVGTGLATTLGVSMMLRGVFGPEYISVGSDKSLY